MMNGNRGNANEMTTVSKVKIPRHLQKFVCLYGVQQHISTERLLVPRIGQDEIGQDRVHCSKLQNLKKLRTLCVKCDTLYGKRVSAVNKNGTYVKTIDVKLNDIS